MLHADPNDPRHADIIARLDRVTDSELDESVISLGFVTTVTIDDRNIVSIGYRLPTYWCSANFAWIMAEDMRDAVLALPWVAQVRLTLDEHMFAEQINSTIAGGGSFRDAFGAEADGQSLDSIRDLFARKAFGRRQLALIEQLQRADWSTGRLLALTMAGLHALPCPEEVERYLDRRSLAGKDGPDAPAFVDASGGPIDPERFGAHLSSLRTIVVNMEFNGVLCRGLLAARYNEPELPSRAPGLIDFVRSAAVEHARS